MVSRRDIVGLGFSAGAVDHRVRSGRLLRLHRGVFAVGHAQLTDEGRWMAAVLAGGDGAVLSHRSAAALWGIAREVGRDVDVTVPRSRRGTDGIRMHRSRRLEPDEATTHRGVPVTTVARTLVDLADVTTGPALARAIHAAEVDHPHAALALGDATARAAGRRGSGRLRRATQDPDRTRSDLERAFRRLCRAHGLPQPEVNATVAGLEVDFLWREQRVVAETDGWAFHRTRRAFEHDRERDQALVRAGHRVIRFTHRQVTTDARRAGATLRAALG